MQSKDIKVGEEYALGGFSVSKVRVLEKGLLGTVIGLGGTRRRDGIRFEVVAGSPRRQDRAVSRDIQPWTERHDKALERQQKSTERERRMYRRERRMYRIADRMGIVVLSSHPHRVSMTDEDFLALAERLGVVTD